MASRSATTVSRCRLACACWRTATCSQPDRRRGCSSPPRRRARIETFAGDESPCCPRCKSAIADGQSVVRCPACGVLHHERDDRRCWTYADVMHAVPAPHSARRGAALVSRGAMGPPGRPQGRMPGREARSTPVSAPGCPEPASGNACCRKSRHRSLSSASATTG